MDGPSTFLKRWQAEVVEEPAQRGRLPWIPGYKPKRNYQNAIFDAIDRYLTARPAILDSLPATTPAVTDPAPVFVEPLAPVAAGEATPERLKRLVRKFDPVERDHRNRALGKAGEAFVLDLEGRRLADADRPDLVRKVRWVAAEDGDGSGYDILSFDSQGRERLIEVKTTNGSARTPFFLTRNEHEVAMERPTGGSTASTCSRRPPESSPLRLRWSRWSTCAPKAGEHHLHERQFSTLGLIVRTRSLQCILQVLI
ncbi:DUF3883 domain-containing protein [Azospirillum sp. Marseille-Q6669]